MKHTAATPSFSKTFGKKKTIEDIGSKKKLSRPGPTLKHGEQATSNLFESCFKPSDAKPQSTDKTFQQAKTLVNLGTKPDKYISVNRLVNGLKGASSQRIGRETSSESRENMVFVLSGKKKLIGNRQFNREDSKCRKK